MGNDSSKTPLAAAAAANVKPEPSQPPCVEWEIAIGHRLRSVVGVADSSSIDTFDLPLPVWSIIAAYAASERFAVSFFRHDNVSNVVLARHRHLWWFNPDSGAWDHSGVDTALDAGRYEHSPLVPVQLVAMERLLTRNGGGIANPHGVGFVRAAAPFQRSLLFQFVGTSPAYGDPSVVVNSGMELIDSTAHGPIRYETDGDPATGKRGRWGRVLDPKRLHFAAPPSIVPSVTSASGLDNKFSLVSIARGVRTDPRWFEPNVCGLAASESGRTRPRALVYALCAAHDSDYRVPNQIRAFDPATNRWGPPLRFAPITQATASASGTGTETGGAAPLTSPASIPLEYCIGRWTAADWTLPSERSAVPPSSHDWDGRMQLSIVESRIYLTVLRDSLDSERELAWTQAGHPPPPLHRMFVAQLPDSVAVTGSEFALTWRVVTPPPHVTRCHSVFEFGDQSIAGYASPPDVYPITCGLHRSALYVHTVGTPSELPNPVDWLYSERDDVWLRVPSFGVNRGMCAPAIVQACDGRVFAIGGSPQPNGGELHSPQYLPPPTECREFTACDLEPNSTASPASDWTILPASSSLPPDPTFCGAASATAVQFFFSDFSK